METARTPENPNNFWTRVFRYDFGLFSVFVSLAAWIICVVWLFNKDMGGLGARSNVVTKEYFNWHPFLMSTAFLLFMTPAVVSFEMYPFSRGANKNIHSILMTCAIISSFAGLAIILDCHNNLTNTGSFLTLHGCVGLFTLIIFAINYIGAFVMYVIKLGGTLRGTLKPFHKRLGLLTILMGLATISIGVQEKADKGGLTGDALEYTYAIGILVYATIGGTVFTVAKFSDKSDALPGKTSGTSVNVVDMASPQVLQPDETTQLMAAN